MKLPRDMDAAQLIKALERIAYQAVRHTGSHILLQCEDPEHAITIPNHRPLRVGTFIQRPGRPKELQPAPNADAFLESLASESADIANSLAGS